MHATLPLLRQYRFPPLRRGRLDTLQVNVGYRCNQSCVHCHVNAGPQRTEMMPPEVVEDVVAFLPRVEKLDLTGGAPELHPQFRDLVSRARRLGRHVIDRCNLTILQEPGQADLAAFLAGERVEIVASLPCYTLELVDRQRGNGVYERSIAALRELNRVGYGTELPLNLVYNPQGPALPPPQEKLEADYRRELLRHGVVFSRLFTLANMPIQRFGSTLISKRQFNGYMDLLHRAHREENLEAVMCRSLISVDWQGNVYDCDFNQMLDLPLGGQRTRLRDLLERELAGSPIAVRDHCYGCTAGQGSSCGGALNG
jgi:radical SAM/Cys-rich protein